MTGAEKAKLAQYIKGMSAEEKRYITEGIPSSYMEQELSRRREVAHQTLSNVFEILQTVHEDMTLNEAHAVINQLRDALSLKGKEGTRCQHQS